MLRIPFWVTATENHEVLPFAWICLVAGNENEIVFRGCDRFELLFDLVSSLDRVPKAIAFSAPKLKKLLNYDGEPMIFALLVSKRCPNINFAAGFLSGSFRG